MEVQLTPEAEKRIIDIAKRAIRLMEVEIDNMLEGYPENHLISDSLARGAINIRLRHELQTPANWKQENWQYRR